MIEVYTDGATQGNPGLSGAGIYIKEQGHVAEYTIPLGTLSTHEAEFQAVIQALKICQQAYPGEIISCRSDSKIVVDTIEKNHTKNKTYLPLLKQINELGSMFPYFFIKWISNQNNRQADRLAKEAIHLNETPTSSFKNEHGESAMFNWNFDD